MHRDKFLPFSPPSLSEDEIAEVVDTLRSDWITTGPKTRAFEQSFAAYVGSSGALALNSCTAALHTALVTLGIGPGDEVVTTTMTFAASVNVIEHAGARPVLVDVEPDTLNLDPERVEAAMTARTKAVIAVHYAGHPAELDPLMALTGSKGIPLIEDAAHALPARYRGRTIGSSGNPTAFSFYATKNLTTAEGGMLTWIPEHLDRARVVSLHGMNRDAWKRYSKEGSWYYEVVTPGFKYNMTDIQASIGLVQLRRLASFQERRREIVRQYERELGPLNCLELPKSRPHVEHAWHLFPIRIVPSALKIDRDRFIRELTERNIGTSVHFIPIHVHPFYREKYGYSPSDFPVAHGAYERLVSLPLNPRLSEADVADVIEAIRDIARAHGR